MAKYVSELTGSRYGPLPGSCKHGIAASCLYKLRNFLTNCFSTGSSLRGFRIGRGFTDVRQMWSLSLQAIHWALPQPALQNCLSLFYSVWRLAFEMDTEVTYMCIFLMQTADFRDFLSLLNLDRGATHSAEEKQRSSYSSWRRNFLNTCTVPARGTVPAFMRCWFLFYLFSYLNLRSFPYV